MAMKAVDTSSSMQSMLLAGFVVALLSLLFIWLRFRNTRHELRVDFPPLYSGWLPWIGCAVEFGKAPLDFVDRQRREMGQVFSLLVAGERMTFLLNPEDFHLFFRSSNVDFQKAVQSPVQRVASVTESSFFKCHTKIHDTVKGKLAAGSLSSLCATLQHEFHHGLNKVETGQHDLCALVRRVMYPAVLDNLFGKNLLPTADQKKYEEFERNFLVFDDQFEYGSKLPAFCLREFSRCKAWLLGTMRRVVLGVELQEAEGGSSTLLQALLAVVDDQFAPNYSLLLAWAALANAIPIMFWTLAFMLEDEEIVKKAKQEVDSILGTKHEVTEEALSAMPYLKCCILEGIRLRSPGIITRRVTRSFTVRGMTIPAGDLLMISPFWAHRNPQFFPSPDKFQPERWLSADLDKNVFLEGFIGFGGGRYQCPGRWFALLELQMFLALFLQRFEAKLLGPVPDYSSLHLVGTQQPMTPCPVVVKRL